MRDFKAWAEEGPPKGSSYNYFPREDLVAPIACTPASTAIANQMYSQSTMTGKDDHPLRSRAKAFIQVIAGASDDLCGAYIAPGRPQNLHCNPEAEDVNWGAPAR